jgi:hypothetical protein
MSLYDGLPNQETLDGFWSGKIANDPGSIEEPVFVTINSFSKIHRFGPCKWTERVDKLPARGDDCLVGFDENQRPYVIGWWET